MYPCRKCLENKWKFYKKRLIENNVRETWMEATCQVCGDIITFGHKQTKEKKTKPVKAEYEIKDGKHFLKIGRKFVEVGLEYDKKGSLKVMPV
jgi:hypothetical protein